MAIDKSLHSRLTRYFSAGFVDGLSNTGTLTEVIRRLNALENVLRAFLPLYVSQDETMLTRSGGQLRPGTFLFADVSGFTALSEGLQMVGGGSGAEVLTGVINEYFARMLEILAKSDGQMLKFAGDALLAFFPETNDNDTIKAVRTGLRMQRAMREFQPIRVKDLVDLLGEDSGYALTMSIGISQGKLFEAIIGNQVQREHLVQGDLPGRAMDAEAVGTRDDVIVDESARQRCAGTFEMTDLGGGFYQVIDNLGDQLDDYEFRVVNRRRGNPAALFDFETDSLMDSLREQLDRVDKVAPFIPPAVLHDLIASGDALKLQSQNRLVVTMFINIDGLTALLEDWGESHLGQIISIIDRAYAVMQHVVSTRGGSITRTDPYQRGVKVLVTFGAPIAHTDDPQRAVDTALELKRQIDLLNRRLSEELPTDLRRDRYLWHRIGITLGPVFAGEVGWRARREYTVMGDDVNLSARLMSRAAEWQILISQHVWERVNSLFETEPSETLQLKGKSKPIQAFTVKRYIKRNINIPSLSETPFVGQESVLQTMSKLMMIARRIQLKQVAALVGDAGLGKTRIAKEVFEVAAAQNFQVAWMTCALRSDRKTTWAALITQLLHLDTDDPLDMQRRRLHARLEEMGLARLESVFADLLLDTPLAFDQPSDRARGAAQPRLAAGARDVFQIQGLNEQKPPEKTGIFDLAQRRLETAETESEVDRSAIWKRLERRTSLNEAIVEFLKVFTRKQPSFIVIDDLHRENAQALQILEAILNERDFMSLVILLTVEPGMTLDERIQQIPISDLPEMETTLLALGVLRTEELGARLRRLIWSRTNGRPLFIEGLLHVLMDNGDIERDEDSAELSMDANIDALPDDARKLIISRVDQLRPKAQAALRAAAVFGEDFTEEALMALSGVANSLEMGEILHDLTRAELLEVGINRLYAFRHGLTQYAVYETMPRLLRQKLHAAAADYLLNQPDWERQPLNVAHHWLRSGKVTRVLEFVTQAGEKAEQAGNIEQAIELFAYAQQINPSDKMLQTRLEQLRSESGE